MQMALEKYFCDLKKGTKLFLVVLKQEVACGAM
jgi:hypothetical protein